MNLKYAVIFEEASTNWAAYVPDLPGCVSTGRPWRKRNGMFGKRSRDTSRRYASSASRFPSPPALLASSSDRVGPRYQYMLSNYW
jgi:hypothetical protein